MLSDFAAWNERCYERDSQATRGAGCPWCASTRLHLSQAMMSIVWRCHTTGASPANKMTSHTSRLVPNSRRRRAGLEPESREPDREG